MPMNFIGCLDSKITNAAEVFNYNCFPIWCKKWEMIDKLYAAGMKFPFEVNVLKQYTID